MSWIDKQQTRLLRDYCAWVIARREIARIMGKGRRRYLGGVL